MKCNKCNNELQEGLKVCPNCGATIILTIANSFNKKTEIKYKVNTARFNFIEIIDRKDESKIKEIKSKEEKNENRLILNVERKIEVDELEKIKDVFKNIIKSSKVTDNKFIKKFLNLLNEYFNKIPHHNIKDLGNLIEIKSFDYIPVYKISLFRYYNKRILGDREIPFSGNSSEIPPPTINFSNVDIWLYPTNNKKEFEYFNDNYVIINSKEVKTCRDCNGRGQNTCYYCDGAGRVKCNSCGGNGRTYCWSCGGRGYTSDYSYEFKQTISKPCSMCMGTGSRVCSTCNGTGIVVCSSCSGSGIVTCSTCLGSGKLLYFIYFDDIYNNKIFEDYIIDAAFDNQFCTVIKEKNNLFKNISSHVFDKIPDKIMEFETENKDFKIKFKELYNNLKKYKEKLGIREYIRYLKEKIEIKKLDVYKIIYFYNQKEYEIYLYGGDQLCSSKSPIYDIAKDYYEDALNLFMAKKHDEAFEKIIKACEMFCENDWEQLKEKIIKKIKSDYLIGASFALIFSYLFLSFGFYYKIIFNKLFHYFQSPYIFILFIGINLLITVLTGKALADSINYNFGTKLKRRFLGFVINFILFWSLLFLFILI